MMNHVSRIIVIAVLTLFITPASAQTKEQVIALVKQTKADIEKDADATLKKISAGIPPYKNKNNPSLYIFVMDTNLTVAAHAIMPQNVGKNMKGKPDIKGKLFRDDMLKIALEKGHGWVDYYFRNPKTKQVAHKEGYIELANGSNGKKYIVGSGKYFEQ